MVHKCDLSTSIQLVGLSKRKSSSLLPEARLNKVLLFSVNDTLYDPSEVILELTATRWAYTTRPCDYTIHDKGRASIKDGKFNELLDLFGETSDNMRMTIYFVSIIPFLIDMERKTEIYVPLQ
jgi:hypothetical protein